MHKQDYIQNHIEQLTDHPELRKLYLEYITLESEEERKAFGKKQKDTMREKSLQIAAKEAQIKIGERVEEMANLLSSKDKIAD